MPVKRHRQAAKETFLNVQKAYEQILKKWAGTNVKLNSIKAPIAEEMQRFDAQGFKMHLKLKTPLVDRVMNYMVKRKGSNFVRSSSFDGKNCWAK